MASATKVEVTMQFEKSTKNTHKYTVGGEGKSSIGELYVQKTAFPEPPPAIKVTVEAVEAKVRAVK
jgi:carbon monoxide dehydrogenase subunit G